MSSSREALGVTDIALDDRFAYWSEPGNGDFGNGRVRRIGHDATEAQSVAVSIAHPVALAASGNAVYVASGGTQDKAFADGAIVRLTIGE